MVGDRPQYAFLAEFQHTPAGAQLKAMVRALDEALCGQNAEYASKRKSLRVDPPVLRVVRRGGFDQYRKRKVSNGSPDGQFKILRLTADAEFAKEFDVVREVGLKTDGKPKNKGTPKTGAPTEIVGKPKVNGRPELRRRKTSGRGKPDRV
jgi:hypothetical protein